MKTLSQISADVSIVIFVEMFSTKEHWNFFGKLSRFISKLPSKILQKACPVIAFLHDQPMWSCHSSFLSDNCSL